MVKSELFLKENVTDAVNNTTKNDTSANNTDTSSTSPEVTYKTVHHVEKLKVTVVNESYKSLSDFSELLNESKKLLALISQNERDKQIFSEKKNKLESYIYLLNDII